MSSIKFSQAEKAFMVEKIQQYFNDEMQQQLGQFEAEFLLDFFSTQFGSYYYNRGLLDAQTVLQSRLELLQEAIGELEKPTQFSR